MKTKFSWRSRRCHIKAISKICGVMLLLVMAAVANAAEVEDFLPKESILYLKLQDIDEVYGEIEVSESWEKALALLTDTPNAQEMQQGLMMFQGMLGTDPLDIIETVGYRTALAIWLDEANNWQTQTGVVIHSGGNLDKLQQLTKIVEGLLGMGGENTLRLNAGVYQRVRYNAIERFDGIAKYGFVDDFLVIGAGEGSFEKLMDTYRTDMPSIQQNEEFAKALEKTGSGEVVVFANVPPILSVMNDVEALLRKRLGIFQSVFGRLNLLETGPFLQVAAQFNPDLPENEIGVFLREGQKLETLNALSVEDDLFVTVSPKIVESMWELVPIDDAAEGISFLEGMLNLNLEEDIMVGLTGELALSVPDFTRFDPEALSGFQFAFDGAIALDAGDVETDGGIIFNPKYRMKWNQVGNSISNLQNVSVSQTNYKGETVSELSSNIFHSEVDGLFLIGFSEEQVYALIDGIKEKKKPPYLKQVPKTPTAFAQLNLARVLEIQNGAPPADKLLVDSEEMALLLAWLSIEGDAALLEVTLSEEETPIEMIAKLVPFFLWNMDVEWE
ncbi:MAG: hypothetical protein OYL97_13065 [Candidatus Poribacteria bacterium]|nr:hypothetical protein [Candidatus Poribacteria bacterium]